MAEPSSPENQHPIPACSCVQDLYTALPTELWPQVKPKNGGLRKLSCPGCGLDYSTNRKTDFCFDCEKKNLSQADHRTKSGS